MAVLNSFKTEEEVVRRANDTSYGLMAGVFTQDINRALRLAAEMDAGMVGVNAVSMAFLNAPVCFFPSLIFFLQFFFCLTNCVISLAAPR